MLTAVDAHTGLHGAGEPVADSLVAQAFHLGSGCLGLEQRVVNHAGQRLPVGQGLCGKAAASKVPLSNSSSATLIGVMEAISVLLLADKRRPTRPAERTWVGR